MKIKEIGFLTTVVLIFTTSVFCIEYEHFLSVKGAVSEWSEPFFSSEVCYLEIYFD